MAERAYTVYRVRGRQRVWRVAALVLVLVLGGLAGGGAWLARADSGHLPPGVEIGGVDVGGLSVADAREVLVREADRRAGEPIVLAFEGGEFTTSGSELGVEAKIDPALAEGLDSRGRVSRLKARLGLASTIEIPLEFEASEQALASVLRRVEREIERKPISARVELVGEKVIVTPSQSGLVLDVDAAAAALAPLPDRVELALTEAAPPIGDEAAEEAKATADSLLVSPPAVVFEQTRLALRREQVHDALRFRPGQGTIAVTLDPAALEKPLSRAFRRHEKPAKDAGFRVKGKRVVVVPAKPGRELSVKGITAALVAGAGSPEVAAVFTPRPADLTTVEAKAMKIRTLVSEFTTPYPCCAARVTNIQLAADILDGQIIPAGARFSLNTAMGERTAERGFLSAPMIEAGRLVDRIGGGVSQVATTFYNAAFFGGLELIEHTPHEFYISRYPMGREATVSWGGPELIFRNDWPAAILIKVEALDTSITVRFYSSKLGRRIETDTGQPYAYQAAGTIRVLNRSLPPGTEQVVQHGGISGFTVEYTRLVYRDGKLIKDEDYKVRYKPENTIVEHGPKKKKGGGQDDSGSGGGNAENGDGGEPPTSEPPPSEPPPEEPPPDPGETEPPPPP